MAKGNYTSAYANVQPSGFDPSAWLHKEQDRQIAIDELQRKRAEDERKRKQEDENAFSDATRYKVKIDPSTVTGVNDYKRAIFDAGKERVFQLSEIMEKYKHDDTNQEYLNAKREIQSINDNLSNQANLITKSWEDEMSKAASGKYILSPDQLKKIDSYSTSSMEITIGQGGRIIMKRESNGDGALDILTKDDFVQGNLIGKLVPNVSESGFIKELRIGDVKMDEVNGLRTTTEKNAWDANVFGDDKNPKSLKDVVSGSIRDQILDENGNLNDLGQGFAYKRGMFDLGKISKPEIDMIVEDLADMKRADMGYEKSIKVRNPVRSGGGSSKQKEPLYQSGNSPLRSTYGDWIKDVDTEKVNNVSVSFPKNEDKKLTFKTVSGKDVPVSNVYSFTKNKWGRYILSVEQITDKGGAMSKADIELKQKEYESQGMNPKQIAEKIAQLPQSKPQGTQVKTIEVDENQLEKLAKNIGASLDELKGAVSKPQSDEKKPSYKGLDKNGNPIFE